MPIVNKIEIDRLDSVCSREEFIEAIKNGDAQFLKNNYYLASYYEFIDEKSNNVLHLAVESGNEALIKAILDDGIINVNYINYERSTPLHLAATKNNYNIMATLLQQKADPNIRNNKG